MMQVNATLLSSRKTPNHRACSDDNGVIGATAEGLNQCHFYSQGEGKARRN